MLLLIREWPAKGTTAESSDEGFGLAGGVRRGVSGHETSERRGVRDDQPSKALRLALHVVTQVLPDK